METLDLMQDVLGDYDGTVLLVSHDRDFIDRVATTTVALEGRGRVMVYPGGWTDYQNQRSAPEPEDFVKSTGSQPVLNKSVKSAAAGLSFTERKRLDNLPDEMEKIEAEIAKLTDYLSTPDLFSTHPAKFQKATDALVERQGALAKAEEEWLALADRA